MASKSVRVRGHSRTPRGPNGRKPRPSVKGYKRKKPNPNSYPRYRGQAGYKKRRKKH